MMHTLPTTGLYKLEGTTFSGHAIVAYGDTVADAVANYEHAATEAERIADLFLSEPEVTATKRSRYDRAIVSAPVDLSEPARRPGIPVPPMPLGVLG